MSEQVPEPLRIRLSASEIGTIDHIQREIARMQGEAQKWAEDVIASRGHANQKNEMRIVKEKDIFYLVEVKPNTEV